MTIDEFLEKISNNKKRFTEYNDIKYSKFKAYAEIQNITGLIEAIPFLLSSNHNSLPGYIQGYEPIGILNYQPSSNAINYIVRKFPAVQPVPNKNNGPVVELMAIMGSAGTIAYNEESDIDYWLCIDEGSIDTKTIEQFKSKLRDVELWITDNHNIETHFFLNDISKVKDDIFDADEEDISGKALGKLLKDEFYRSSILLYGKIPFWWAIPPGSTDENYEKYLKVVKDSQFKDDFIDLGNLNIVQKEEFLGAGLFQILKSLGNPFKSILKIGILEKYLLEEDKSTLLCNRLKAEIQKGNYDTGFVDGYIFMFNQVLEYYQKKAEEDPFALEVLKRCFYIKIDPRLSEIGNIEDKKFIPEKQSIMMDYTKKWNWLSAKIRQMDDFHNWELTALNKFWNNISKLILKTYKKILDNIETQIIEKQFTGDELQYISRRIRSSFSYGTNKIKPAISFNDNPIEKFLFIESISQEDGSILWLLSKGFISGAGSSKRSIMHKESSLLAILAWIAINRLFQKNVTRIEIKSRYQLLEKTFVRELLNELTLHFSPKKVNIKNKYFFHDPFPVLNFIIINLSAKYPKGIEDVYYLYHNSWGETIYEKYEREIDLSAILTKLLNGAVEHSDTFINSVYITSPYPYKASKSFKSILFLFNDIYEFFTVKEPDEIPGTITRKYLTVLGGNFILFSHQIVNKENKVTSNVFNTELTMLYSLSSLQGIKNIIRVNPLNPELNHLKIIIENFRADAVQIYYQKARKYCYFFVSDERGSIFFFRKKADNFQDYLTRLYMFSRNIIIQVKKNNPESVFNNKESKGIEIFKLDRNDLNKCRISEINPSKDENIFRHEKKVVPLKLSLLLLESGELGYRFSLPDGGISENLTRTEIEAVSGEMSVLMQTNQGYNYSVTDINFSNLDLKMYKNFTTYGFTEKNRFELLIEKGGNF
ncbi:MAG: class I adenylate cyclase [Spirochaetes bacterium]|nr:class I adenylate cyclase [Spirochaetota bacterium]